MVASYYNDSKYQEYIPNLSQNLINPFRCHQPVGGGLGAPLQHGKSTFSKFREIHHDVLSYPAKYKQTNCGGNSILNCG